MLPLIEIEKEKRRRFLEKRNILSAEMKRYKNNPLDYFEQRLGIKKETINWALNSGYENHKWDGTENPFMKILNSIAENKWVGVESAVGTGKTFMGALITFWFLECFENSLVITTAPKQDQLSLHIWKEIGRFFPNLGKGDLTQLKLKINNGKGSSMAVGFVAGVKADEESSTRAQGFHAEHMLFILEETPGIPVPVMAAFQNTCTSPHNLILAFGNPDSAYDNLHKFCRQSHVVKVRISAFDHPNVVLDNPTFIPGAASREGIHRIEERFGKDNPLTISRTRGIPPSQSSDSLIKMEWIKNAVQKYILLSGQSGKMDLKLITGVFALGVDVADSEHGDKAAIAEGKGEYLLAINDFQCNDANQLAKRDVYFKMKERGINPANVGVDGVGVGAGAVNALKELGLKIVNIKGSESPVRFSTTEEFINLRSQIWWQMREDLCSGEIAIPDDSPLIADLVTPKWFIRNGKIAVESKEDIKRRLGRSPNKGDAAVYWNWVRKERKNKAVVNTQIF